MKQADILVLKGVTMVEKRQEALEEQSRLEPRVDLLAGRTRELQKMVLDYCFNLFMFTGSAVFQLTQGCVGFFLTVNICHKIFKSMLIYTEN